MSALVSLSFGNTPSMQYYALPQRKIRVCKKPESDPFCLYVVPPSTACDAVPSPHHLALCKFDLKTNTKRRDGPQPF